MDVKSGKANLFVQAQQATSSEAKITEEKKALMTDAPIVAVIAEKKAPVRSGATAKTESQMSASATQAQLTNRLDHKFKAHFAQKKAENPVLKNVNAERGGQVRDNNIILPGSGPRPGPTPGGGSGTGSIPPASGGTTPPSSATTTPPASGSTTPPASDDWKIDRDRGWNATNRKKHYIPK